MEYFWLKTEIFFCFEMESSTNFQRQVWLLSSRKTNMAYIEGGALNLRLG